MTTNEVVKLLQQALEMHKFKKDTVVLSVVTVINQGGIRGVNVVSDVKHK